MPCKVAESESEVSLFGMYGIKLSATRYLQAVVANKRVDHGGLNSSARTNEKTAITKPVSAKMNSRTVNRSRTHRDEPAVADVSSAILSTWADELTRTVGKRALLRIAKHLGVSTFSSMGMSDPRLELTPRLSRN